MNSLEEMPLDKYTTPNDGDEQEVWSKTNLISPYSFVS